jgi:hypothetical protein
MTAGMQDAETDQFSSTVHTGLSSPRRQGTAMWHIQQATAYGRASSEVDP